jgi:hypothetical protein
MKCLRFAAAFAVAVLVAAPATAKVYDFSFDGINGAASGSFTVNSSGLITDLSGTQDGDKLTIDAVNTFASNDNLYPLTVGGLSFNAAGLDYNLYLNGSQIWELDAATGIYTGDGSQVTNLAISAAPEPATWAMFLMGLGTLGFLMRGVGRHRERVAAV